MASCSYLVVDGQPRFNQDLFKVYCMYLVNHGVARALAGVARILTSVARSQAKCDSAMPLRQTFMHAARQTFMHAAEILKRSGP